MKNNSTIDNNSNHIIEYNDDKLKLQLREEQLSISKELIRTGEVIAYKETFTKEKTITVPLTHVDLVIEKRIFKDKNCGVMDNSSEVIRIPLSEEQIDVTKHQVILEDVNIYKHEIQDKQLIEEVLKKEKAYINTTGNPKLIDNTVDI